MINAGSSPSRDGGGRGAVADTPAHKMLTLNPCSLSASLGWDLAVCSWSQTSRQFHHSMKYIKELGDA